MFMQLLHGMRCPYSKIVCIGSRLEGNASPPPRLHDHIRVVYIDCRVKSRETAINCAGQRSTLTQTNATTRHRSLNRRSYTVTG
ncbi:hypothetical protein J6590_080365 [Homalodisca vitripennis]|nr:hypothetical protein J6590_080365 [Homalodisca vitripennis]